MKILILLVLGCGLSFNAKADFTGVEPSSISPTFQSINATVFSTQCLKCHSPFGSSPAAGGIDFTSYDTMMKSNSNVKKPFLVSGDPEHSDLYLDVKSGDMPKHGTPLDADSVQAIFTWIQQGAQNN